jgi:hypothetical protein
VQRRTLLGAALAALLPPVAAPAGQYGGLVTNRGELIDIGRHRARCEGNVLINCEGEVVAGGFLVPPECVLAICSAVAANPLRVFHPHQE